MIMLSKLERKRVCKKIFSESIKKIFKEDSRAQRLREMACRDMPYERLGPGLDNA
jgi:hypothetical protein